MNEISSPQEFDFFIPSYDEFLQSVDALMPNLSSLVIQYAESFRRNLNAVISTISIPFQMAFGIVQTRRYTLLRAAEELHAVLDGELTPEKEKTTHDKAAAKLAKSSSDREGARQLALQVRDELNRLSANVTEFSIAVDELNRQGIVLMWGALEVLAEDLFVALLNNRPDMSADLLRDEASKRLFKEFKGIPLDTLEQYQFDISRNMGDVLISHHRIDNIPVMKTVYRALFPIHQQLHDTLAIRNLFILNQRRNLIVHRRG